MYSFCFGADLSDIPYITTYRSNVKHNYQQPITKKDVGDCFSGVLQPLVKLRDVWMSKYSIPNITWRSIDEVIHTNAIGLKFNLNTELKAYKEELKSTKRNINNSKIASSLLAFYSQGTEQLVTQSIMASEYVTNNILTCLVWRHTNLIKYLHNYKTSHIKPSLIGTWIT